MQTTRWLFCAVVGLGTLPPVCVADPGQTLRQLLAQTGIPATAFQNKELDRRAQGASQVLGARTLLAYQMLNGEVLEGPLHLVDFNSAGGGLRRADLPVGEKDLCNGSVVGFFRTAHFTVLSQEISPSAGCLLILDANLKLRKEIFGFDLREIAPDRALVFENMIHFATVHPQRLEVVDLANGSSAEIYPVRGDRLRMRRIDEHRKKMPLAKVCEATNDPCQAEDLDEDASFLATDGKGKFSFVVEGSANHAPGKDQKRDSVVAQKVLYVYDLSAGRSHWRDCEKELKDKEVLDLGQPISLKASLASCQPNIPVVALDLDSANFSPFSQD